MGVSTTRVSTTGGFTGVVTTGITATVGVVLGSSVVLVSSVTFGEGSVTGITIDSSSTTWSTESVGRETCGFLVGRIRVSKMNIPTREVGKWW